MGSDHAADHKTHGAQVAATVSMLTMRIAERTLVLQAQGVLMERHGYTARAAQARICVCAHKLGVDVSVVASAVIARLAPHPDRQG